MGQLSKHALAAALCVLAFALAPAAAQAQCGDEIRLAAKTDLGLDPAPLAIGDSVMLLAIDGLAEIGYDVNAHGCRGFGGGLRKLRKIRDRGRLPELVVLALGADHYAPGENPRGVEVGKLGMGDIRKALEIIRGQSQTLALVTPRVLGGRASPDAKVMRRAERKRPNRIEVLDWVRRSKGHDSWFVPDGIHLTYEGADQYIKMFSSLLPADSTA